MSTFIIAEAGVNHNGNLELAKKLIEEAKRCGCDAVKFQTFKADRLVTKRAKKAKYQIENTNNDDSQYNMLKKLELSYEDHIELIAYCKQKDILFLSTPFDEKSADLLEGMGMEMFKIPSGEITNKPFLNHIAKKKRPIILSTGMSTLGEVEEALEWIYEEGNKDVILLHCTTSYPTDVKDVNLRAMLTMKEAFKVDVGYSDHTLGIEVPVAAVTLGAVVIEKHFTLDSNMEGPDHKASLEPHELEMMVTCIKNIEKALGDGIKKPTEKELDTIKVARKSIMTNKYIKAGETITRDMLCVKRPGNGLEPKYIKLMVGRKFKRDMKEDELICFQDID